MTIKETDIHISALAEIVAKFCTPEDLAVFAPTEWVQLSREDADGRIAQNQANKAVHEERTVIAKRILGELEAHEGEHREALDHLNEVIPVHVDPETGERNNASQLSVLRDALGRLAKPQSASMSDQEVVFA